MEKKGKFKSNELTLEKEVAFPLTLRYQNLSVINIDSQEQYNIFCKFQLI